MINRNASIFIDSLISKLFIEVNCAVCPYGFISNRNWINELLSAINIPFMIKAAINSMNANPIFMMIAFDFFPTTIETK